MISFQMLRRHASRMAALMLVTLSILLDSCKTTSGLPDKLPEIALNSSTATPTHHMAGYEYPFDSSGNYVSDWAAEGERRAGRSATATSSDEEQWAKSHANRKPLSSVKKIGPAKSKSSSSKSKKTSTESKPAKSKSSGSRKHVVKSSDTLSSIAKKYGTTVSKIKNANGLKSDKARSGSVLTIPK